ncbi:MAG: menaquinone biosynthesis protein [Planctomycetota bacterium]|nr:menaquinone biosynthesis protein [Planctomycetota bacterium]
MVTPPTPIPAPSATTVAVTRLGVVSFLNTRPIIRGLDAQEDLQLQQAVPSRLVDEVVDGRVDVGMCSSIDYLRSPVPLKLLQVAPLTSDGQTLTVRVFSTRPLGDSTRVYCDIDSHTSVALLRILLRDCWNVDPEIIDFDARAPRDDWPDTVMLIGDKVVHQAPTRSTHSYQVDLGEAWKQMTDLPFVFALWMARADACEQMLGHVSQTLAASLAANLKDLETLIREEAKPHGWPESLATRYLNGLIRYELGPRELEGLRTFHDRAVAHGLAPHARPLDIFEG